MTQIVLIILCMIGSAFFSGMETGVISIHRMRLRHSVRQGDSDAVILERFIDQFDRLLGTTLVGTNICNVAVSVTMASLCIRLMGPDGNAISVLIVAPLILVLGEYLPKAWFSAKPLERCRHFAGMLYVLDIIFRPVAVILLAISRLLAPFKSGTFSKTDVFVTRDDLKKLAHESEQTGAISPRERVMIHRVFDLSNKAAREVMVPLERMITVPADMPVEDVLARARETGFTRMPVRDPSTGRYTGIVNVIYILSAGNGIADRTVQDYIRPPLFIAADMPVDEIMPLMRKARQPMCLVQGADGAVIGLMTTENILSEIVGRLRR